MNRSTIIAAMLLSAASAHAWQPVTTTNAVTGSVTTNAIQGRLELHASSSSYWYKYTLIPTQKDRFDDVAICIWILTEDPKSHYRSAMEMCPTKNGKGQGEKKLTTKLVAVHAEMVRDKITLDVRDSCTSNQLERLHVPQEWWKPGVKL